MHWYFLALAILSEVVGTLALKMSNGFSILLPSIIVVVGYSTSFWFLALCLKSLHVGTAYAIWAGVGTAVVSIAGVFLFKEPMTIIKAVSLILVILGVVGLHWGEGKSV
tara:strand:+ start:69 stop:395 length:327 start_codon:yes stop_codon:yes gene_type:complete